MDGVVWVFLDLVWEGKDLWTTLGQRACWTQHTHTCAHAEKLASIALSDSKTEACSVHTQRNITCMSSHASQEKKSLKNLAVVHTHPQNYAFVSNNVAFSLLSIARLPNGSVMVTLEFLLVTLRQHFTTVSWSHWHTLLLFTSVIVVSAWQLKSPFLRRRNYSFSLIQISLTRLKRWVLTALIRLVYEIKLQKLPQTSAHMTKVLR